MNTGSVEPAVALAPYTRAANAPDTVASPYLDATLRDAHRAVTRALAGEIAARSVSIGHWYFLLALWQEEGLTQRDLSNRVGMMEPTTVTALSGMEKQGLVRRVRNRNDRRKVNVYLTDRGRELRAELLPAAHDVERAALAGFSSEEARTLRSMLRRVANNLQAAA